jgi:hypothetical protein
MPEDKISYLRRRRSIPYTPHFFFAIFWGFEVNWVVMTWAVQEVAVKFVNWRVMNILLQAADVGLVVLHRHNKFQTGMELF